MRIPAIITISLLALPLATSGCKKEEKKEEPAAKATATEDPAAKAAAEAKAAEEEKKAAEETEKAQAVAERIAKWEAEAAEEAKRWTPELVAKAKALREKGFKNAKAALTAILASEHRDPQAGERDRYRHPVETLTFFGIEPTMTVVEVGGGGGWYTEILAPLLAEKGKLRVAAYDPSGPATEMTTAYGKRFQMFLDKAPVLYDAVEPVYINPPDQLALGEPGSADLAVAIREMHGWQRRGYLEQYLAAVHDVLKDGGTFGVVQHRAAEGADPAESAEKGYLPEAWLIETVEAAGFELVEKSDVNANPKDTKDYEKGVWTLPPNFAEGDTDKDKYAAIGESDRMTLKFKKVTKGDDAAADEAGE